MRKSKVLIVLALFLFVGMAMNTYAQSLTFKVGMFFPELSSDLWEINMENLAFEKEDLQGKLFTGEYEHYLGPNASFTIEGSYFTDDHYSFYRDYEYEDSTPIYQNLSLTYWAIEAGFKFYPMGHRSGFAPFIGGGGGVYHFKYEQWGDFINFDEGVVEQDQYLEASKYTIGFNAKAGFVFRVARNFGIVLEGRYIFLKGDLGSFFEGFEKLDISGFALLAGFSVYF